MFARIAQWQPDQGAAVATRAVGALALSALAVIHVVDLPGTLGPTPLVGIGYLGIVAAAVLVGGVLLARPHWLVPVWLNWFRLLCVLVVESETTSAVPAWHQARGGGRQREDTDV